MVENQLKMGSAEGEDVLWILPDDSFGEVLHGLWEAGRHLDLVG